MELTSPAFTNNSPLPQDATCKGKGVNPPLQINGAPQGTQSLALVMHDPDAVGGQDFLHWLLWNITPDTTDIGQDTVPSGAAQGTNDYRRAQYGPACPPPGTGLHHYTFDLYALDAQLELPPGTERQTLEEALKPHTLATAQLIGTVQA